MKAGTNHNRSRTDSGRAGFRWNYYERKVGVYLTLHCPLRTQVGKNNAWVAWETMVWVQPRESLEVRRDTWLYDAERQKRLFVTPIHRQVLHQSYADLRVQYDWVGGGYVPIKDLGNGLTRERWQNGTKVVSEFWGELTHKNWAGYEGHTTKKGLSSSFDLLGFNRDVLAAVAGCAAQGRFDVLHDWFIDHAPDPVARLFDTPGPL